MSDIVDRLREMNLDGVNHVGQAADVIEALRAELAKYQLEAIDIAYELLELIDAINSGRLDDPQSSHVVAESTQQAELMPTIDPISELSPIEFNRALTMGLTSAWNGMHSYTPRAWSEGAFNDAEQRADLNWLADILDIIHLQTNNQAV